MPSGQAPTAECPTHGGNFQAALIDPNAPRLFLIEQDEFVAAVADEIPVPDYRYEVPTFQQREVHVQIPAPDPAPRHHIQNEAEIFEERFRQLLREYNIH